MILKKKIYSIATILPYKESYTSDYASAVSLWVSEYFKRSKFKKNNYIYGNTKPGKYLTKNYINIPLNNLKFRFKSTSNEYTDKLINELNKKKFEIIEIHNRPLVLFKLLSRVKSKFIIYFHNDPISMSGSKTVSERKEILNKVDKLIFISEWVKKRFFKGLEGQSTDTTEIIYHGVEQRKKIKKTNYITYVGKLNYAKGYDLYKDALIKILDNYPDWMGLSIGDESRRKIYIKHKQHKELGFLNHQKTMAILDKSDVAVVPSRWEEPFGRVAMEAASCGCATITSNTGGLPETSNYSIIIDKINSQKIYEQIKSLIENKIKKLKIQNLSRKNIKHSILKNTKLIDLKNNFLLPGFIDNHTHFIYGGTKLNNISLQNSLTQYEFINAFREYIPNINNGLWLQGGNWDHENWGGALPNKSWIDSLTNNNPVLVSRVDGHMALANSKALEEANINENTPNPVGGEIVKDINTGIPTGILKDTAIDIVRKLIPKQSHSEQDSILKTSMNYASSQGITQIHDMATWDDLQTFRRNKDKLTLRIKIS